MTEEVSSKEGSEPELDSEHIDAQRKFTNTAVYWLTVAVLLVSAERGCSAVAEYRSAPVRAAVAECLKKCQAEGSIDCELTGPSAGNVEDPDLARRLGIAQCANVILNEQKGSHDEADAFVVQQMEEK